MAFNIGGGPRNQMSLLELIEFLSSKTGKKITPEFDDWRPGDQKVYVSDITKVKEYLGWAPKIDKASGTEMLWEWVSGNKNLFGDF